MQQATSMLGICGYSLREAATCWLRKSLKKRGSNSFSFTFSITLGFWNQEVTRGGGWDFTANWNNDRVNKSHKIASSCYSHGCCSLTHKLKWASSNVSSLRPDWSPKIWQVPRWAPNLRLAGYKVRALTTWPKGRPLGQVARAHEQ